VSKTSPQQQPSPTQAPDFADQSSMSYDQKVAAERTKQQIFSTPKSKTPSMVEHEAKLAEERTQQTILTPQLQRAVNKLPGFRSDEPDQGNERIMPELPAHLMQFFPGGVANNLLQYYSSTGKPLPQGTWLINLLQLGHMHGARIHHDKISTRSTTVGFRKAYWLSSNHLVQATY
jgi:hypothetical protein